MSGYPISLTALSLAADKSLPHGFTELRGTSFTDGTSSPASGTIRFLDFLNKTIGSSAPPPVIPVETFTYGTYSNYSSAELLPPSMSSTSSGGYTIYGHAGNTNLTKAFNRSKYSNYSGSPYNFIDAVYQGPATNWSGWMSYDAPWVRVDLPSVTTIKGIVIRPQSYTNVMQKLRLLGSDDGSNWQLIFTTGNIIYIPNPGGGSDTMNPHVLLFTPPASYSKYAFAWGGVTGNASGLGNYLPRLAQFNLIY